LKITLVNPISGSVYSQFRRALIKRLPIGLAYVASYLETNGHEVSVIDADTLDLEIDGTVEKIMRTAPDAVGVTATTPIINNAFNIIQRIKDRDKRIYTFVGGPHVSAMPAETLQSGRSFLDYVVFGEGEDSCLELVRCIGQNGPLSMPMEGVGYINDDGKIIIGTQRPFKNNLDLFPFPARHLFPMSKYVDHTKFGDELYTLITTSRGCPYECTFCGSQITWHKKTRLRSPQNVVQELKECVEKYDITNFTFCDDTFTLNKRHAIEICRLITELPYKIRLFCSSRVNTVSEDRLDWLKKAGCYCITFGLESGNDVILNKMKKGINIEMIRRAVAMTKEAGIEVHGSFILGFEDEDEQTIEDTISFALSLNLDQIQFSILVPLPGTECYTHAHERNAFRCRPDDFTSFYWYYSVPANMTKIADERLIELQRSAYERYNASKKGN
jgi:anaerobic magnesium-protoporphyrin IX monomethyl ester cyclase